MSSSAAAAAPASSNNNAAASSPAPAATPTSDPSSPAETPTDDASSSESPAPTDSSTSAEPTSTPADEPTSTPAPTSTSASDTPAPTDSSSAAPTTSDPSTTTSSSSSVVTSESTNDATTILITSTEPLPTSTGATNADSSGSQPTTLGSTSKDSSSGLSPGGTIAVAVVVPVVSVAILVLLAIWWFRKWKGKKAAEEMRRKEVEEYGFNPNNDPTLPPVGGAAAYDHHTPTQPSDDVSGYRGWGTTSAGRKASTNLSSGAGGMGGLAMSEASSVPGYHNTTPHHQATPSDGTMQFSDGSAARPMSGTTGIGEEEAIGVLGAGPAPVHNSTRVSDIRRGPSNASSAYSAANHSETSDESNISATHPASPFYDDAPYDPHQSHAVPQQSAYGAYGDGPYAAPSQPVIRDVQARRNTRIESPAVFPRQGNAGIAQNF